MLLLSRRQPGCFSILLISFMTTCISNLAFKAIAPVAEGSPHRGGKTLLPAWQRRISHQNPPGCRPSRR